ncbi:WD repeat-containing protein, putative [Plasmodium chabaudi chabaudi]|uniref:WD repeat-containing protein, putative n=1 Tax=Plasmodium chabaudi chabaudi TaxID=31271 RepID=A0A1C6YLN8_PLACU|nr:WD repeat-containing protein, putative [Plasmodium chabaudi chabaudi]
MNEDLKLGSVIWPNFSSPFNITCYGLNYEGNILAVGSREGNIVLFRAEENEKLINNTSGNNNTSSNEAGVASNESGNKILSNNLKQFNSNKCDDGMEKNGIRDNECKEVGKNEDKKMGIDSNCEEANKSGSLNSTSNSFENFSKGDENSQPHKNYEEEMNNRIKLVPYNILLNNKNNGCNNSVTQLCFGLSCSHFIECVSREILISLYVDNTIALWSLDEGRCFKIFNSFNFYIYNMRILQDRRFILVCGYKDLLVIDLWANPDKEVVARLSIENKESNDEVGKSGDASDPEGSNGTHYDIADSDINYKMCSSSSDNLESNDFSMVNSRGVDNCKENNEGGDEIIDGLHEDVSVKHSSPSFVTNISERNRYSKHSYYDNSQFLNYKLYYDKKKNENSDKNLNLKICCISAGLVPYLKKENQRSLAQCMKLLKRKFFNIYEKRERTNLNYGEIGGSDNNNMRGDELDEEYIKLREKETYKNLNDLFYCPILISAWLNNGDIICWDLTDLLNFYKNKTRFVIRPDKTEIETYNEKIEDMAENCIYNELIKNKIHVPNDINLKSQDKNLKNTDIYEQTDGVYNVNPIFISNLPTSKSDLEISANGNSSQIAIIDNYIVILQKNRLIIYERKNANSSFVPLMDLFCPDFDQSCKKRTRNAHWIGIQVLRKPIWRFSSGTSQSSSSKIRSFNIMQNMSKNICGCIVAWTTEGNFYCYTLPLKFSSMFLSFQSNIKSYFLMKVDKNLLGSFKSPGPILFYRNTYSTSEKDADLYEKNISNSSCIFSPIKHNNEHTDGIHLNNSNEEMMNNKYSSIYNMRTSTYSYSTVNKKCLNERTNLCEIEKNTFSIESTKLKSNNIYNEDTNVLKIKNNNYRKNKNKSSIWGDDVFFLFVNKSKLNRIIVYEYLFDIWYTTNKIDSIWLLGKIKDKKKINNILEDNERGYKYGENNYDVIKSQIEAVKNCKINLEKMYVKEMNNNAYNRKENIEHDENEDREIITYAFCEYNLNIYVIISYRDTRVVCVLINCYKYVENKKIIYDLHIPDSLYKKKNFITALHAENNYIIGGTDGGDILIWNVYNFSLVKFIKKCHFSYICSIYKVVTDNYLKKNNVNISTEREDTSFILTCDASNHMILINLSNIDYNNNHNNFFCKNDECNIIISSEDNIDSVLFWKKEKERLQKNLMKRKKSKSFEINICNKTDRVYIRRTSSGKINYKNKKKRKSSSQISYVNTAFKRSSVIHSENRYKLINILNFKNAIKNYQEKNNNSNIYNISLLKAKKSIIKLKKKTWDKRYEMERKLKVMTHVCFHCCFKKLEKKNEINFKLINNVYINSYSSLLYISLMNNYVYIYNYKNGNFLRYLYDSQYSQISNIPFENVYTRLGVSISNIQLLNKIKVKKDATPYLHESNTESEITSDDVYDESSSCSSQLASSSHSLESIQQFLSSDGMEISNEDYTTSDSCLSKKDGMHSRATQFKKNKFKSFSYNNLSNIICKKNNKKTSYLLVKSQIPIISHILFRDNHLSKKALPLGRLLYHHFLPDKCINLCKELFFFLTDFPSLPFSMCVHGKESTCSVIIPKYTQLCYFSKMYPLKLRREKFRKNIDETENEDIINYRTNKKELYIFLSAEKRKKKKKKKFFYDSLNIDYKDIYNKQFKNKYFLNDSLRKKYIYFGLKFGTKQNENKHKVSELMNKWKSVYGDREENWDGEDNQDMLKKWKINKDNNLYTIKVNDKWELPNSSNSIYKEIEINYEKKTDKNYNRRNNNLYILQYNCSNNRNIERNKNIDIDNQKQWMSSYLDDEMDEWDSCDSSSSKSSIYLYIPKNKNKNKNKKHISKNVRSSVHRVSDTDKKVTTPSRRSEIKGNKYGEEVDIKKKLMNSMNMFSKRENKKIKKRNKVDISYFFNDNSVEICCESLYVNTLYFCFILRFVSSWFKMCRDKYNDNILINFKKYIIYNLPNNNKINLFLLSYISMYPYDKSIRIQLQKFMFILIQNMKNICLDKYSKLATEILRINNKKKRIIKKTNDNISLYDTTGTYIIQIIIPRVGSHYLYPYVYADEICLTLLLLLLVVKSIYLRNSKIFYSNASMATLIIHHICYYIFVDTQNLIENTYNKFNKFKLFHFIHLLSLSFSITWDFVVLIQKGIFTNNMKNVTYSNFSMNIKDEDFIGNEQIVNENFYKNLKDYYILAKTLGSESLHHSSSEINLKNCMEDYIMKSDNDHNNMNEHHYDKHDLELSSYENAISDENNDIGKPVIRKASESGEHVGVIINSMDNEGDNETIIKSKIIEEQKKKIYAELCNINNDVNKIFSNKKCPFNENNYISICHFILNIFELYTLSLNNISFLKILINIGRIEPFLFLKTLQYISCNLQKRVLYINKILFLLIILIKNYKWIFKYYMNIIIDILLISLDPSNNVRMVCLKLSTSLIYTLVKNFSICAFNKFTQRLAVANNANRCIYLYDLKNAKKLKIFQGHKKSIDCINFNSNGTCLASYSKLDFSFKIWNCSNAGLFSGFLKVQSKCSRDIQLSKIKLSYLFLSDSFINITYKKKNEWVLRREDNVTYLIYT